MSTNLALVLSVPSHVVPDAPPVRMAGDNDNPLWCLADLCRLLGISNVGDARTRLDEDDIVQTDVTDASGRKQLVWFVTEPGLYVLLLRSDKPAARPFRSWVTKEVIPSVRKHGCYPPPAAPLLPAVEVRAGNIIAVAERAASLLTYLSDDGELEARDRIALRDFVRTHLCLNAGLGEDRRSQPVTLPERAVELGFPRPARGQDSELGKCVAAAYRQAKGRDPDKHVQFVDGRAVRVNSYTVADLDVLDEAIRSFFHRIPYRA